MVYTCYVYLFDICILCIRNITDHEIVVYFDRKVENEIAVAVDLVLLSLVHLDLVY
jgi:hypothetical protein